MKDLGAGQYGLVFQGKLPKVIENETVVAVKTLREGSSEEAIKEFCQEVNIMSTFSHPNVVRLVSWHFTLVNHECFPMFHQRFHTRSFGMAPDETR